MLSVVMVGGPIMVIIIGTVRDVVLTYVGLAILPAEPVVIQNNLVMMAGLVISFGGAAYLIKTKHRLVH